MKVDELLKHLENIKINEDEKREIAEYIAQTFGDKGLRDLFYVMMKDKTIYVYGEYRDLLKSNKISPNNAYVYIDNNYFESSSESYFYPFLGQGVPLIDGISLINAYLSKLGFETKYYYRIAPATGLKYVAVVYHFPEVGRTVVEVANIDNVVINTHLPILMYDVLSTKYGDKYMTNDEVRGIISQFISQKLFAGHTFIEAQDIIRKYYKNHDITLAKEVEAIGDAYDRIFQPYRVVYDLNTKQFQISDNNEDR
jgi:hypothetical protein